MELPLELKEELEKEIQSASIKELKQCAQKVSERYREDSKIKTKNKLINSKEEALAYAVSRMPATYGSIHTALENTIKTANIDIQSVLDIGAGTGSAEWAILDLMQVDDITCIENETYMMQMGKKLMQNNETLKNAKWMKLNIAQEQIDQKADLVIASYVLNEIEEKTQLITSLQESLAKRDVRIAELDEAVTNLTGQVEHLTTENEQQKEVLMTQDEALNTVYYALGTNKELKEQKIVEGGGLFSSKKVMEGEFNKNYFTAVDMRKLHDIPFDSKKAKLLTNHPEGTYELQKDNEGYLTLVITNPDSFWSLSRYLVVELN